MNQKKLNQKKPNPKKLNPITRFLQDKLMPDLSSPACLSLTQAILLEHAKDMDAIGDLIDQADTKTITPSPEPTENTKPIQSPRHSPEDLWIGPAN